ncbi:MAG TPA: response regulator, partial [Prolixibacteraceae bacterium]|nr:response regulator [Prolixibacteraceae bacterium]
SIVRLPDGMLWTGSWGGGLNRLSTGSVPTRVQRINAATPGVKNDLVNYFVSSLWYDEKDFLLIGTEGGLSKLDQQTLTFTTLTAPQGDTPGLTEIGCILKDVAGYYWMGTRNGLFRFHSREIPKTDEAVAVIENIQFFSNIPDDSSSLPGNYVASLLEDSHNNIWIGTYGKGVAQCRVDSLDRLICRTFTQKDGLSNNVVYGIQEDLNGNMWFSTDYGLSMLRANDRVFRSFYKQDGLLNNQFYWSASHKSSDGTLFFGGTEGLNFFKPETILENKHLAFPRVTKMRIFNEEVEAGDLFHNQIVIEKPISLSDTVRLSYRDNNVSFDFSSFDYYLPEKTKFAYQMSGIDKGWIQVDANRRFATYSNLSGGTYRFLLKAANCDGVWNEKPTELTIIITPPFWKTQWFKILLIFFVVLATFIFIQLQLRQIIQQKNVLEEKVKLRTQQIEDQKGLLEKQANELIETNHQLAHRQNLIEHQKEELERKTQEISAQRDELLLLNDKVNDINQLQLKFFTNISHEFRTPLTLILSPVERLIRSLPDDMKDRKEILQVVERNARRLMMLINQLLEIRKIETGNQELQVEKISTGEFLYGIYQSFLPLARKNEIDFQFQVDVSCETWIDREKLENVLYNLLSNAFKFTPSGEKIFLSARCIATDGHPVLLVSVRDTGCGISPGKQNRLFDRFYQVTDHKKHVHAGTGIGLSLVKSLVEIMRGTIEVNSIPGQGSEFIVRLPVDKEQFELHEIDTTGQAYESELSNKIAILSEQLEENLTLECPDSGKNIRRVLVVEDHAEMRSYLVSILSGYFQVLEARNGKEGYELAKKEDLSLIITDVMMPEMNGIEFCNKIKNNLYTSHIPVVMLTAKGEIDDQIAGLEQGADDYITKPFHIDVLIAKAQAMIENRRKIREKFRLSDSVTPEEITTNSLDQQFFSRINEIIEKHYTDSTFDVDQFASEMFVSRSQLYKKLKAITDLSANDFINVYRLKKSVELLRNENLQISEIAYSVGFNDPKYFSRIFKKYFKHSPTEQRNNHDIITG